VDDVSRTLVEITPRAIGSLTPRLLIGPKRQKAEHHMLEWMKNRQSKARTQPAPVVETTKAQRPVMSGKYLSLYKYLDGRFADRVVLKFTEIEDLLGFALPDLARVSEDWWTIPDQSAASPRFSDSWILAKRSARPNLLALTVVFDRVP
jgi:hypothetical protein